MISCRAEVGWISTTSGVVCHVASICAYGIDEQGAAVLVAASSKIFVETLSAEEDVKWMAPCEVEVE